jgi:hypothetical protein
MIGEVVEDARLFHPQPVSPLAAIPNETQVKS